MAAISAFRSQSVTLRLSKSPLKSGCDISYNNKISTPN